MKINVDDAEFRVLLDLCMTSDPWPLSDSACETFVAWLTELSRQQGYASWEDAYHRHVEDIPRQTFPKLQFKTHCNYCPWTKEGSDVPLIDHLAREHDEVCLGHPMRALEKENARLKEEQNKREWTGRLQEGDWTVHSEQGVVTIEFDDLMQSYFVPAIVNALNGYNAQAEALEEAIEICQQFVAKVDAYEARSVETYTQCCNFLYDTMKLTNNKGEKK